ncbi:MAG: rhamnogalacturonan acetylesterase [Verrucomicrobiota bacterium]
MLNRAFGFAGGLGLLVLAFVASAQESKPQTLRVVILGDSTVCDYQESEPTRGWGQFIQGYFTNSVRVFNHAQSGRSTKTFIKEGLWEKAKQDRPDVVLIQFGHNDSHGKGRPESTDAATDYKDYLRRYIDESRALGATPILVTPMHRRLWEQGKPTQELLPYANAMKEVGAEKGAAVIDLHALSGELYVKLGEKKCLEFANKDGDRTHFSERGAREMAKFVMSNLPNVEPRLKFHLARE